MSILKDVFKLFYPDSCLGCDINLLNYESFLCASCRHDLPIIKSGSITENEIIGSFYGRVAIAKAASFLYFRKEGITKELIHHLKYKNNQKVGSFLGNWFGTVLKDTNEFTNVDIIVPVPLHPTKLKKRGYNQLTTFGESLSEILQVTFDSKTLTRVSVTQTQTIKKRFDRFTNINTKFNLMDINVFANKHILLIDDVITTGATLEACCNELNKTQNITISIVTIAFTQKK